MLCLDEGAEFFQIPVVCQACSRFMAMSAECRIRGLTSCGMSAEVPWAVHYPTGGPPPPNEPNELWLAAFFLFSPTAIKCLVGAPPTEPRTLPVECPEEEEARGGKKPLFPRLTCVAKNHLLRQETATCFAKKLAGWRRGWTRRRIRGQSSSRTGEVDVERKDGPPRPP